MKAKFDAPAITLNPATASGRDAPNKEQLPLFDVPEPGNNDVLSGRGVTTNKHAGNVNFRSLVALNKELYVTSTKKQKMAISRSIVEAVRSMNPPGRFLDKNAATGLWSDIGDRKAIEKTSQALRDGAATLRKQLSEDLGDPDFLSAVFESDPAGGKSNPIRSDGSASGGSTNGDAKKLCRPRLMKSKMAKKGHRRVKSVPQGTTGETKKVQKRARLDQVVPIPESAPSTATSSKTTQKTTKSNTSRHERAASAGAVPSKPTKRSQNTLFMHGEEEEMLEGLESTAPWNIGHSRNSSASSTAMALPPFFPMSPIGRHTRLAQGQQHIFSCFQEPKRPPMSPMHRSWSPRDFQQEVSPFHWRQSIGGTTCFSEGDIDLPSLDRTFDRTFLEEDMHMAPILSSEHDDVMGNGSERVRSSRTSTPSNKDAMGDMDLRYSPELDCELGGKNDLVNEDVIMKDSDDPAQDIELSPLPFMEDSNTMLLDNLPELLQMPLIQFDRK